MPNYICDDCGDDLKVAEPSDDKVVRIEACKTCMDDAYDSTHTRND